MDTDFSNDFLVKEKISIKETPTEYKGELTKQEGVELLKKEKEKLRELQEKLYADGSQSLLVIIQAMDAAGKDSLIEHVFGGVNPQGCNVTSSKLPVAKNMLTIFCGDIIWQFHKKG